jgi:8-oxo-dGTP pyrophosphatase MutT (NUDIX family)
MTFLNPLPVAVVLVPVEGGLMVIRRGVEPCRGKLALPGGYINLGESWQEAGAREVLEEAGIVVNPADIRHFGVGNGSDGVIVIFGLASPSSPVDIPPFTPNEESTERLILREAIDLAFPLHTEIVRSFFRRSKSLL